MYFKLRAKIFVCCICLASEICALEIDDYKYKRVEELNDKIALDAEIFLYRTLSAIHCISKCALIPNCESVFYFQSSCKGYSVVYSPSSSNLTLISGARYYVNAEEPTEETITERNAEDNTTERDANYTTTERNTEDTITKRTIDDTTTERNSDDTTTGRNTEDTANERSTRDTTFNSEFDQTTILGTQFATSIFTTRNAMLGKLFFCKQLLNLIHFNLE